MGTSPLCQADSYRFANSETHQRAKRQVQTRSGRMRWLRSDAARVCLWWTTCSPGAALAGSPGC